MLNYANEIILKKTVAESENKITEAMKNEGFGLVSRINMKEKFKEKLNIEFVDYLILGFCNPSLAYEAVTLEEHIGILLPCNVVLFEKNGETNLSIVKPSVAMSMIENDELKNIAMDIDKRLEGVLKQF